MSHHEEEHTPDVTIERAEESDAAEHNRLGDEFKEFGTQLMRAVRAVADSDELRRLGNGIVESLKDIGEELQDTYEATREKEEVRAVGEQAKRVTRALGAKEGGTDIQAGLSQALHSLNDGLNKVIDQIQARSAKMSEEVDSTVREAEAEKEQFKKAMDETLDRSAASDDNLEGGAIHESTETLEQEWHEETQDGADLTDDEV